VGKFPRWMIQEAGRKRGWKCEKCGRRFDQGYLIEAHHIHPTSQGGRNTPDNMRLLCTNCHWKTHCALRNKGLDHPRSAQLVKKRLDSTYGGRTRVWIAKHR